MSNALRRCYDELAAKRDRLSEILAILDKILEADEQELFSAAITPIPIPIPIHVPELRPSGNGSTGVPDLPVSSPATNKRRKKRQTAEVLALFKPGIPVTPREVAQRLDLPQKLASNFLSRMYQDGLIQRRSHGRYALPALNADGAAPAVVAVLPKPEPIVPLPVQPPAKHRHMVAHQIPAILEYAAGTLDWFQVTQVEAWLRVHKPGLIERQSQAQDLRVRMIDLARDGKLERRGSGAGAFYRRAPLKEIDHSDARISVPRDPDAGQF